MLNAFRLDSTFMGERGCRGFGGFCGWLLEHQSFLYRSKKQLFFFCASRVRTTRTDPPNPLNPRNPRPPMNVAASPKAFHSTGDALTWAFRRFSLFTR